jgi:hypothetical protein
LAIILPKLEKSNNMKMKKLLLMLVVAMLGLPTMAE